ncbi:HAMP domain-containing sensor histidine kinase [Nocardia sp. BMG51109]|uniref:sensor histidine kinase n=1 Tax=Nocardia sp. BMG51109 TaxID=1056816 RepID=UPI000465A7C6|nr:HAMP domain-containing sensor histidine kinase [Nocardia sp. BMG51109]
MRRRLLTVLTVFATLAVVAFAVPLCLTAATSRTQQLMLGRSGDADWFAGLAGAAAATGDTRALTMEAARYHEVYAENVLVVDARGATVANAGVDARSPEVVSAVAAARRNQRAAPVRQLMPWSPATVLIARPVGTGVQVNGAVLIQASTVRARADIARIWGIAAGGALAALVACTALALVLSRWVLRPLAELSTAVARLTARLPKPRTEAVEDATMTHRHGGPPEIRAVAESFDAMALTVVDSTEAQRQLVADTAHAMRNPLAALTIRLDSLEPVIPGHAAATFRGATGELERLTGLLDSLLTLAVAEGTTDFDPAGDDTEIACDAVQVARDRVDAWRSAFDHAGLTLTTEPLAPHPEAAVDADTLARILDVALSNSCRYAGAGAHTRLIVAASGPPSGSADSAGTSGSADSRGTTGWADSRGTVTVTVTDDGAGVGAGELDRLTTRFYRGSSASATGSGLGLPIAAALANSRHGTLTVEAVVPHGLSVVVRLPAAVRR